VADLSPKEAEIPAPLDDETAAVLAKTMTAFRSVMVSSSPERPPASRHGWQRVANRTRHGRLTSGARCRLHAQLGADAELGRGHGDRVVSSS
jgi:hypothetical protein